MSQELLSSSTRLNNGDKPRCLLPVGLIAEEVRPSITRLPGAMCRSALFEADDWRA